MRRLIFQVNVPMPDKHKFGNKTFRFADDLFRVSNEQAAKYAAYLGADYKLITDCSFLPNKHPTYQRLQAFEWGNDYDEVCYLDSDAIVLSTTKDSIFEAHNGARLSSVYDWPWERNTPFYNSQRETIIRNLSAQPDYMPFCAGVLVMSSSFMNDNKENWKKYIDSYDFKGAHDQGIMNRLVIDEGGVYNVLDPDWGAFYRKGKNIIHLVGHKKDSFEFAKFSKRNNITSEFGST